MDNMEWIVSSIADSILEKTKQDADLAQQVADMLASLDWKQVIREKQKDELNGMMAVMKNFIEWRVKGGDFCDDCEETKYVGGYHHGPQYEKLYSWPYEISPYINHEHSGKRYCWKHFCKLQEKLAFRIIIEYRTKHPGAQANDIPDPWGNLMAECGYCGRLFPQRTIHKYGFQCCFHCIEHAVARQFICCKSCKKKTASAVGDYCYDCYQTFLKIGAHVNMHLSRAREANTPATLTVKQWAAAITYFGGKCAYCQSRPFQVLEHFVPISRGGGTTADNCVPACNKCNSKKKDIHPDKLLSFHKRDLERVKNYLRSSKDEDKPYSVSERALVIYQPA
jgi:hypothetical protein